MGSHGCAGGSGRRSSASVNVLRAAAHVDRQLLLVVPDPVFGDMPRPLPAPTGLGLKAQKLGKRKLSWLREREGRGSRGGHLDHRFVCRLADREVEEAER